MQPATEMTGWQKHAIAARTTKSKRTSTKVLYEAERSRPPLPLRRGRRSREGGRRDLDLGEEGGRGVRVVPVVRDDSRALGWVGF
jgi:hypothetical protein